MPLPRAALPLPFLLPFPAPQEAPGSLPSSRPSSAPAEAERSLAREIRDETMLSTVRSLVALGPRMGGTESGARSAAFVEERFHAAGLAVEAVDDPPLRAHEETKWSLEVRDGSSWRPIPAAVPYGFSKSGEGTGPLRLGQSSTPGAVLLLEKPPRKALASTGALAALVDGEGVPGTDYSVLYHLPNRSGDIPVFAIPAREGERLRAALGEGKAPEIRFSLEAKIAESSPRTVLASVPGRDRSRAILFCAHGDADSGGPGADDNASGVAVVLEIARALAAAIRRGDVPPPPCDLRFAVWGSEIHSTGAFVRREREAGRLKGLAGVLNFDQAGFGSGDDALFVEPDDEPRNERLVRALLAVALDHRGEEGFPSRFTSNRALGGTDSYVFQEGADGPPSVTVFTSAFGSPSFVEPT
ncbi:MAG TPA: M28 family peptidase, partial [Planctomycetota bacterium]|nr:M28 family peptidase [Planctomycetota bacterium]